jgi:dTDP-4-dehydrorhamnose 3,5-epimerase-like enzyme
MTLKLISGTTFTDLRGTIRFNNDFDVTLVKRMYFIENASLNFIRAWQGHKIESRWFTVVSGAFKIQVVTIDNWENPNSELQSTPFLLDCKTMDILYVPNGCFTSIQALEDNSRLLVMSDYRLNEIQDEFRYPSDYFKN